jgi:hypothetical protein
MPKTTIDPRKAQAELIMSKRVLRAEKRKARKRKGSALKRANAKRALKTVALGVEAAENLRDSAQELKGRKRLRSLSRGRKRKRRGRGVKARRRRSG